MLGFDRRTSFEIAWAFHHPLQFGWRMLHCGNIDFDKEVFHERENLMVDGALGLPSPDRDRFLPEIAWLKANRWTSRSVRFPYDEVSQPREGIGCFLDDDSGLPYVMHGGKRLYFRKGTPLQSVAEDYRNFIDFEGLLGGGILEKSPHAYVSSEFAPDAGDVILDVGCAEGLFALEYAPIASRVYLFEAEKTWAAPIQKTFSAYESKVDIISKFVGNTTSGSEVKLTDVVRGDKTLHYFLKMDIEGAEVDVIRASLDFLSRHEVRISCCTYHRQSDADIISAMLQNIGYRVSFSDGYMLTPMLGVRYPYFRHGVLWAKNF